MIWINGLRFRRNAITETDNSHSVLNENDWKPRRTYVKAQNSRGQRYLGNNTNFGPAGASQPLWSWLPYPPHLIDSLNHHDIIWTASLWVTIIMVVAGQHRHNTEQYQLWRVMAKWILSWRVSKKGADTPAIRFNVVMTPLWHILSDIVCAWFGPWPYLLVSTTAVAWIQIIIICLNDNIL